MRKLLLAIMATICLLTGCTKHCGFRYLSNDTPALKKNDYNSCEAIVKNLTYTVCGRYGETDFPYWTNEGDTIMVCGYFSEYWLGNRDQFALFDSPNNGNEHTILVDINGASHLLPEEIDISKKCYVVGRLHFDIYRHGFGSYPIVPRVYDVYDVHFE